MKKNNIKRFEELVVELMNATQQDVIVSASVRDLIKAGKIKAEDAIEFISCVGAMVFSKTELDEGQVAVSTGQIEGIQLSVSISLRFVALYLTIEEAMTRATIQKRYA